MKKLLPKTFKNPQGFTLVELLVVISIIAILSVIGLVLFSNVQKGARDSKRVQDVIAISKALEANYTVGTGYATAVSSGWFTDNVVPTNPTPGGVAYNSSGMSASGYTICAGLENSTGNASTNTGGGLGMSGGSFFCKKNAQ